MHRLTNSIQGYAWGSRSAIAGLLGAAQPSEQPQAELWMGAHPAAPSRIEGLDGRGVSLGDWIAQSPTAVLGPAVINRFGGRLPFLMKVLAAEQPLSLQAHPSAQQAHGGFEREELAGIPLSAANRIYKDRSHKPELLCAMTPFEALCGFRAPERSAELLARLEIPGLEPALDVLRNIRPELALSQVFTYLCRLTGPEAHALASAAGRACADHLDDRTFSREYLWAVRLAALHPGDIGIVIALLLNFVQLQPGEAIYIPSGELHAYLGGVGIEIMASSDNVLRGGLTPKHVDCAELARVLQFAPLVPRLVPTLHVSDLELRYESNAAEFALTRITVRDGRAWQAGGSSGPEILLCWRGQVRITGPTGTPIDIRQGQSIFVPASAGNYRVEGAGQVFRATVGGQNAPVVLGRDHAGALS